MFFDALKLPQNTQVKTDVCIIGAGPAGIALACVLQRRQIEVCLLESGEFLPDPRTRDWDAGTTHGLPFDVEETRTRCFGGTSHIWAGRCVEMDTSDFAQRSWVPHSGWPFGKDLLDSFYTRAKSMTGPSEIDEWASTPPRHLQLDSDRLQLRSCWLRPTDFGRRYRKRFQDSASTRVYLNARAVRIELTSARNAVQEVIAATAAGKRFSVRANFFVLAAGGIENPRLLLSSDHQCAGGVGNEHDLVGRFFANHMHLDSGLVDPAGPLGPCVLRPGTRKQWWFLLSPHYAEQKKLLSCGGYLRPVYPYKRNSVYQARGPRAVRQLAKSFRQRRLPADLGQTTRDCLLQPLQIARFLAQRTRFQLKTNPQLIFRSLVEGRPNPQNHVRLVPERDSMGIRRVLVRWTADALDAASLQHLHSVVQTQFRDHGIGAFQPLYDFDDTLWLDRISDGKHHMGTTRIHHDPQRGVVDPDCRVHSTHNLYVAGSSVFPTYSCSNPTLTIIALAIRLAEHLTVRSGQPGPSVQSSQVTTDAG